jgi:hypothetical protein
MAECGLSSDTRAEAEAYSQTGLFTSMGADEKDLKQI